jgi:hypothetical protein
VEARDGRTRVVVARGRATVLPALTGKPVLVEAPAVLSIDASGASRVARASADPAAREEVRRLRMIEFNTFEADPPDAAVAFLPQSGAGRVSVTLGKKLVGIAPLTMLAPAGTDEATLTFEDGSTLVTTLTIEPSATTVVSFTAPVIKTEHLKPRKLVAKTVDEEPVPGSEEQVLEPENPGYLAPQIVKMVLKKQNGRLRDCYQKYLDREPGAGIVKARIRFTIGAGGKVTLSEATSDGDGSLEACLAGAVQGIDFPPPSGGSVEFEYPITFAPK